MAQHVRQLVCMQERLQGQCLELQVVELLHGVGTGLAVIISAIRKHASKAKKSCQKHSSETMSSYPSTPNDKTFYYFI